MTENKKPKPEQDDPEQSQRFIEDAKQLAVDDTGDALEKVFGIVTSFTPKGDSSRQKDKA